MSVEEHKKHAEKEQEVASKHREKYDEKATAVKTSPHKIADKNEPYETTLYNPTKYHLKEAKKHQKYAKQHQKAAEKLINFEEKHCAKFPEQTRKQCPLLGTIKSAANIPNGIEITLREGVPVKPTVEHIKCHFAFARTVGYEGMKSCPLYLKKVLVEQTSDSRTIKLTTTQSSAVKPLRKRTRAHVTSE